MCIYSLQKSRPTVAAGLAEGFLAPQLKFSHPKEEKPAPCFLAHEGAWLGRALQGQARASAAAGRQKTSTALPDHPQHLPPHTALSVPATSRSPFRTHRIMQPFPLARPWEQRQQLPAAPSLGADATCAGWR